MLVNGTIGVMNVYWMVEEIRYWNFLVVAANLITLYVIHRDLSSVVIGVLTYPLGLFTPIWIRKERFSQRFKGEGKKYEKFRSARYLESMPLRVVSKLGSVEQKKVAILEIRDLIKNGVEVTENMKILSDFLSSENQDVALYASEAINEIESYYVEKVATLEHVSKLQDIVEFCYTVLNVIKTNLIVGRLIEYYKNIVVEKAELIKEYSPTDYYMIMYEATSNIDYLEEGFEKTSSQKLLSILFIESIKKRRYDRAREIAIQFPEVTSEL
jgi:hypothetical protein